VRLFSLAPRKGIPRSASTPLLTLVHELGRGSGPRAGSVAARAMVPVF